MTQRLQTAASKAQPGADHMHTGMPLGIVRMVDVESQRAQPLCMAMANGVLSLSRALQPGTAQHSLQYRR